MVLVIHWIYILYGKVAAPGSQIRVIIAPRQRLPIPALIVSHQQLKAKRVT